MTLTISTQTLLVIIHQLICWSEFRRVNIECECWIWVRISHATKRGEALVVQIAKGDAEVADELHLHQHDISIRHAPNLHPARYFPTSPSFLHDSKVKRRDRDGKTYSPDLHIMPFNYWMHTHEPRPVIVRGIKVRQELAMRVCPSRSHEYSFDGRLLT